MDNSQLKWILIKLTCLHCRQNTQCVGRAVWKWLSRVGLSLRVETHIAGVLQARKPASIKQNKNSHLGGRGRQVSVSSRPASSKHTEICFKQQQQQQQQPLLPALPTSWVFPPSCLALLLPKSLTLNWGIERSGCLTPKHSIVAFQKAEGQRSRKFTYSLTFSCPKSWRESSDSLEKDFREGKDCWPLRDRDTENLSNRLAGSYSLH